MKDLGRPTGLGDEKSPTFLERPPWKEALLERLSLQCRLKRHGEVRLTCETLQKHPPAPDVMSKVAALMKQMD